MRWFGGVLVLTGMVVMAWNLWHTAANARARLIKPIPVPIPDPEPHQVPAPLPAPLPAPVEEGAMRRGYRYFEAVEKNAALLGVLTLVMVSLGGLSEITPLFIDAHAVAPAPGVTPYDPLRLAGKGIDVREGCHPCHSQMIRALRAETQRYGHF